MHKVEITGAWVKEVALFSDGKEKKESGEESRLGSGRPVNKSLRATQGSGRSIYGGKV